VVGVAHFLCKTIRYLLGWQCDSGGDFMVEVWNHKFTGTWRHTANATGANERKAWSCRAKRCSPDL